MKAIQALTKLKKQYMGAKGHNYKKFKRKKRKADINSCVTAEIEFYYPQTLDTLDKLIEDFMGILNSELSKKT